MLNPFFSVEYALSSFTMCPSFPGENLVLGQVVKFKLVSVSYIQNRPVLLGDLERGQQNAISSFKVTSEQSTKSDIRRRRKCKADLEKEQNKVIETRLLANNDRGLNIEQVAVIENKGRGVKSLKDFSKGEFVVEYAGDLVDTATAKDLEGMYSLDIYKGCYMYYFKHREKQFCINATEESGRFGRLLNHSRVRPNCVTRVFALGDTPRLIIVAKHDIKAGTELVYDYGDYSKESLKDHPWLAL
jgi:histone-lysine N-methyltransferase SETD8